jgi:hypothetical protein
VQVGYGENWPHLLPRSLRHSIYNLIQLPADTEQAHS